jgi:hypothetical protein
MGTNRPDASSSGESSPPTLVSRLWQKLVTNQIRSLLKQNSGQILVKFWSNSGQILVKFWSNSGQILVKFWSNFGDRHYAWKLV